MEEAYWNFAEQSILFKLGFLTYYSIEGYYYVTTAALAIFVRTAIFTITGLANYLYAITALFELCYASEIKMCVPALTLLGFDVFMLAISIYIILEWIDRQERHRKFFQAKQSPQEKTEDYELSNDV